MTVILNAAGPPATGGSDRLADDVGTLQLTGGPASGPDLRRRAVLVVDDEPTVRLLITEVLDDLGCLSLEAVDGQSALLILRSGAPLDLMITDVGLPGGMSGRLLASTVQAERPGLAILFITGYAETAAFGDGAPQAHTRVLTKPFSIDALTAYIKELLS